MQIDIKGLPEDIPDRLCERFRLFGRAGLTETALRLHDQPMEALDLIGAGMLPGSRRASGAAGVP